MGFTPERLRQALESCLAGDAAPVRGLCVALSGGLDSTVLLAALARQRDAGMLRLQLRAIHVDHGLHPDSADWSVACRARAEQLRVPLALERVIARATPGESPEAAARRARYAALRSHLGPDEALVTAHHADDQLETILLQWLRGGGLRAIAGMPPCARLGTAWHLRPLLGFTRAELRAWASQDSLSWLEDPSNLDTRFDRNYLRLQVLPAVRARWPAAARTAGRAAKYAAEALELEEALAGADLDSVAEGAALVCERLQSLPDVRQRAVLRAWLRRLGLPVPALRTLVALRHDMQVAAQDRIPSVNWSGATVRRYRGRLYASGCVTGAPRAGEWRLSESLRYDLANGGALELTADVGRGLSQARLPARLLVTTRVAGTAFVPAGGARRRPLRKWLQERGALPWRRDSLPIACAGDEIVAIADLGCARAFAAQPDEPSWRIVWHGRGAVTEGDVLGFSWHGDPPIR